MTAAMKKATITSHGTKARGPWPELPRMHVELPHLGYRFLVPIQNAHERLGLVRFRQKNVYALDLNFAGPPASLLCGIVPRDGEEGL